MNSFLHVVRKGTGARAGQFGVTIAGKTGTAQNAHGDDHALFAGYAPADDPRFVAVAVVEAGKHGSSVASPIVGELPRFAASSATCSSRPTSGKTTIS